jgi:peptide/nickel transport system substrate-binding protein
MKKYQLVSIFMLAFLMISLLAGCSPKPEATEPAAVTENQSEEQPEQAAPAEQPPAEEPEAEPVESKVGGTLVMGISNSVQATDIQQSQGGLEAYVHQYINATLLTKDIDGNIVPYLAESWTVSDDGLVYDFKLRQDVTWHNGEPMTAQDWVYTFTRAMNGTVVGVLTSKLTSLQAVEAVDDYTFRVTLTEPYFPFLFILTTVWASPVQEKYVSAQNAENGIDTWIGVGPYKFVEYQTDEKVVLERNTDYVWGPDFGVGAGSGPYNIETIEIRIIKEDATLTAGLEAGEIDFATIQPVNAAVLEENFNISNTMAIGLVNVSLNCEKAPFDDIRLRQAVNYATDRDSIVQIAGQGNAAKILGPISPSVVGYWDGVEEIGLDYDLEKARALIAEAGYTLNAEGIAEKDGVTLDVLLDIPPDALYVNTAQLLQQQWKEIGVNVTIQQDEWGVLIQNVVPGNYTAAIMDYGDYEADFMYGIFISSNMNIMNISRVVDTALDDMLIRTRTTVDPAERQEVVDQVQEYITTNAFLVPIMARQDLNAMSKRVQGLQGNFFTGLVLTDAYIEE